jgi:pimeloyl-ACP methyl ester carboxylesterase
VSAVERRFAIGGYHLAAKEWHPQAEYKIIACHGWLDNAASFDVLAPLLPSCHIVALDMPGHGYSDHKPAQASYNIWDDLLDILAVADQLGWQNFYLLGHSRGAIMSMLLASALPERIDGVVMLDAILPPAAVVEDSPKQLGQYLRQQRTIADKRSARYNSADEAVAARCKAAGMCRDSAQKIVERGLVSIGEGFGWRSDPRLTTASAFKLTDGHNQAFIKALTCPYLLLLAEQGIGGRPEFISGIDKFSELRYTMLAGSHHFHMEQQTPIIADLLSDFVQQAGALAIEKAGKG